MRRFRLWTVALVACISLPTAVGLAQTPPAGTSGLRQAAYEQPAQTGRSRNPALAFFGDPRGPSPRPLIPQPAPMAPQPIQMGRIGKPFSGMQQTSGVSPYLALDSRESGVELPNYYLFVKPRLEQQAYNQAQQAQYQRLQRQVRNSSSGGAIVAGPGGIPTTGHSTQFMNNGGYYPAQR